MQARCRERQCHGQSQRAPTLQRTSRPSKSLRPGLPSVTADTMIAASAGPKRAGNAKCGDTDTRGITGHVRAYARAKNITKGWRLTKAVVLMVISSSRLQRHDHGRDHEADEGYRRSQPADHVNLEVPLACFSPVVWRRIDLPTHEDPVDRLGDEGRR